MCQYEFNNLDIRCSFKYNKIYRKRFKEDFMKEFKKFKNWNEEVIKFEKRSAQNLKKQL